MNTRATGGRPLFNDNKGLTMKLICDIQTPIATLTLNQPEARNALSADVRDALISTLEELEDNPRVRAVIITGAGEHFCAGGDIRTMGETDRAAISTRMIDVGRAALAVGTFKKPLIAAIRGHAAGAGVSLACLCDAVVADESARFTFAFLKIALGPDWGLSHTLPLRVGQTTAKRLLLASEQITAEEAHRLGLIDRLVAAQELDATARDYAERLALAPSGGAAAVKMLLNESEALKQALAAETRMQTERFLSQEHLEGVAAFREKRKPRFHAP